MKILVTGGAGHIGVNVCLEAIDRGHEVICMDNFVRPLTEENIPFLLAHGVTIIRGDVRNKEDFEKLPQIDAIVHLAGQCGIPGSIRSPFYDFDINTVGTLNVLEYSRTHGKIPVTFASSNKAYTDYTNTLPLIEKETRYEFNLIQMGFKNVDVTEKGIGENFPLDAMGKYGRSPYGTSKVAADLYCQEYYQAFGVPTVVNRMSCIYGYFQKGVEDQGWVDHFIRAIAFGDGKITIFGNGKQVRDMLFGSDVARLYIDEIEQIDKVKGEVFNVGGGIDNTWSLLEAVAYVEKVSGKKANIDFQDFRHADQRIWISNISKVKEKLGWQPTTSPSQGVTLMYEQYLREGKK